MRRQPTSALRTLAVLAFAAVSGAAAAQQAPAVPAPDGLAQPVPPAFQPVTVDRVMAALALDRLAEVLAAEIAAAGDPLRPAEPGTPDPDWTAIAARIAPAAHIRAGLRDGIGRELDRLTPAERAAVAEALGFWESDLGRRAQELDLAARAALADPVIEAEARAGFAGAAARSDPRIDQIRRLVDAADLVEPAVANALSIAMASLQGIHGTLGMPSTPEALSEDVWLMEPEIRADQAGWIEALFYLSTVMLTQAEIDRMIAEAGRPGSRRLGQIVESAATGVFVPVARELGRAAALRRMGQQL